MVRPRSGVPSMTTQQDLRVIPQSRVMVYIGVGILAVGAFTASWGAVGPISDVCLVLALGIALLHVFFGQLRFITPVWMWIAPLGVIICAVGRWFLPVPENMLAIRYVATPYVPENLNKAAIWMAALVLVPLTIVAWSAIEPRTPRWVMGSFIGGVALSAAISVTDLLQVTSIATSLGYDSNNSRQTGLTDHPNTLGFTCAISLPIAIFFMARRGRVTWIASRLAIVILLGGVVACGSRGTQFAAPIIILATLMSAPERRRAALKNVAITLAVSTAALFVLVETLASNVLGDLFRFSTGGTGVGDSDAERAILLKQAINDVESYPVFGVGLRHIVEAHNIYLQILASGGLVLGFAMLAYWIGVISSCWQLRARGSYLGACLLISMLTWLGLGTIENQLTDRLLYFTVGSVAALVSVVQSAEKEAYLRGAWLR
ncbi:MAG: hypothetical protein QOC69_1550 [Mycobacterium sp.]|nr:hypothetical protein [Mycobacterium sp.]